ncbi:ABC transporter ATP-binding protein/permease wht-1 [Aphelenchoides fujianensis]|nr:ABC transporter ATP-binding protein/permease wht-1 [Aphelenchoides fujianensis]
MSTSKASSPSRLAPRPPRRARPSCPRDRRKAVKHTGQGCDITWNNLTVSVVNKAKKGLLHTVQEGQAERAGGAQGARRAARHLRIGSFGRDSRDHGQQRSGKSTLLNVLTNIDQQDIKKDPNSVDVFIGTLTVEEQLRYSAALRMEPQEVPVEGARRPHPAPPHADEPQEVPQDGDRRRRHPQGISVGEKKRLAFACELLTNPDFFFCDEPASGLDSFMALQVANVLHEVAKKDNKCVITTIHQPSDEVFQLFNKVCFLSREKDEGRVRSCPFLTKISRSFDAQKRAHQIHKEDPNDSDEENELVCSPNTNPTEHVSNRIISRTTSDDDHSLENRVHFIRQESRRRRWAPSRKRAPPSSDFANPAANKELEKKSTYPVSWFEQTAVLFRRSMKTIIRDPVLLQVRFIQIILTAFVIGIINWQTPITGPTITNLEGILYNCPRDMNFMFLFPSIHVITSEFPIMAREYHTGIYSASAYYVGKSHAELPQYTVLPLLYSTVHLLDGGLPTLRP